MDFETYAAGSRGALLRYAAVLTNDRELAQDLVQDVMFKAAQQWRRIGELDHPHPYVRRMLTNEAISWHRKWGRIQPAPGDELDGAVSDDTDAVDRREALHREVARLPIQQRAVIVLRYLEDLSEAEIAEVVGCRPATVRSHIRRALVTLRVESSLAALGPVR